MRVLITSFKLNSSASPLASKIVIVQEEINKLISNSLVPRSHPQGGERGLVKIHMILGWRKEFECFNQIAARIIQCTCIIPAHAVPRT